MKTKPKNARALFRAILPAVAALCFLGCVMSGEGAESRAANNSVAIMTWNLQLLFDDIEEGTEFGEFTESSGWNREKYAARLNVIAKAIGELERAPDIIAVQEVESARVVADLADSLSAHRYGWTHFARLPGMSLGVGLLSRYPLEQAISHSIDIDGDIAPRPILEAKVNLPESPLLLFACHWKSKLGGEDKTESTRQASARVIIRRMRELAETDPQIPVIVLGDLNATHDEFERNGGTMMRALMPDNPAAAEFARAWGNEPQLDFLVISHDKPPEAKHFPDGTFAFYSPWTVEKEDGSYFFRNSWETIDHFLLSSQLFDGIGWQFHDSQVVKVPPFATYAGLPNAYNPRTGRGVSDHLPLMLLLRKSE